MKRNIVIEGWTIEDHPKKQDVINKHRDINTNHDWWDSEYDWWKGQLQDRGFNNVDISFSGFGSQGDGASFTADIDVEKFIRFHKVSKKFASLLAVIRNGHYISASVTRYSSHYVHSKTIRGNVDLEYQSANKKTEDRVYQQCNDIENLITSVARDISGDIYKSLEKEADWLMGDEAVEETLRCNYYVFDTSGRIIA